MSNVKIEIHHDNLNRTKKNFKKEFPTEYKHVNEFLRYASIGKINKGKKISDKRLAKYLYFLKIPFKFFKKPINKVTLKDMEKFITNLEKDKIKRVDGKKYRSSTKADIKITLRIYLKYRQPKKYIVLTDWIDYRIKKSTPNYLSEKEAEKLYNSCKTNEERFLVTVLFDSGARAEEFLNIRFEDIIYPSESFPYFRLDLKEEYSKTKGRKIGLFWKYSTQAVKEYLDEQVQNNPKNPVYNKKYDAIRMFITRRGKKVLNKRVHFHLFRKGSATYYAKDLNRQQLCVRYGWKFSSDMPDIYISRAGLDEEVVKDRIEAVTTNKLEKENQELKTQMGIMKEQFEGIQNSIKEILLAKAKERARV
jgi:integrase/recombinase XerD